MHDVVCSDCGKQCQVPFKPDGTRPVYCQDCYQKHRPARAPRRY
jgi:CxxC-x17-CxxC domain-containing protein